MTPPTPLLAKRTGKHRWCYFRDPIYGAELVALLGPQQGLDAALKACVPDQFLPDLTFDRNNAGNAMVLSASSGTSLFGLVVVNTDTKMDPLHILTHEAFHISTNVLLHAGLTLDDSSQEAFAYYFSWVWETMQRGLKMETAPKGR